MFDEQQESAAERGDATDEGSDMPSPPGERSSTEPMAATKGPDAGEGETRGSGETLDEVQDEASGETGSA